jgi:NAD(P)-dependent dehydrogenase (short-subunit alcohol dehydrogenase family)
MSKRLSGRVCIITGTGGGMGRETALTFAREGALVVGCDLQVDAAQATVEAVRTAGGTIVSLQPCHLSEPADCQSLVPRRSDYDSLSWASRVAAAGSG